MSFPNYTTDPYTTKSGITLKVTDTVQINNPFDRVIIWTGRIMTGRISMEDRGNEITRLESIFGSKDNVISLSPEADIAQVKITKNLTGTFSGVQRRSGYSPDIIITIDNGGISYSVVIPDDEHVKITRESSANGKGLIVISQVPMGGGRRKNRRKTKKARRTRRSRRNRRQ